jgi:hypothetical protein
MSAGMTEPLRLTDLHSDVPRASLVQWVRIVRRTVRTAAEFLRALPRDLGCRQRPIQLESGTRPDIDARRIAIYVHFSATGQISEMVRRQLEMLRQTGFAVVFVSMAALIPENDWLAVRGLCAMVAQRENFGLDFGAWNAILPEVRRRWPVLDELMLVNDSVLGPIHPLAPVIETMRAGGAGLFGLTENLEGGVHLQSYMLLARGEGAVGDLMHFVQRMRISHSKWLLIQRGEIRLARWMRRRGHRVAVVFGYDRLMRSVVADRAERKRLAASHRRLRSLDRLSDEAALTLLRECPPSPMHHMWRVLTTRFGAPFLKTELILRNPWHIPEVADWLAVVPPDAPCPVAVIQAHLATMRPLADKSAQQKP